MPYLQSSSSLEELLWSTNFMEVGHALIELGYSPAFVCSAEPHTYYDPATKTQKPCGSLGKAPHGYDYTKYSDNPPTHEEFEEFRDILARRNSLHVGGVCIVLGRRDFTLDVDVRSGGDLSLEALYSQYGQMPDTPTVRSGGGGLHFHFTLPDGYVLPKASGSLTKRGFPGIEYKANHQQLVAPSTMHVSGRRYEWLDDALTPLKTEKAIAPAWLLQLFAEADTVDLPPGFAPRRLPDGTLRKWSHPEILSFFSGIYSEGTRRGGDGLPRLVGILGSRHVCEDCAVRFLGWWQQTHFQPPLEDSEIETHVRHMYRAYKYPTDDCKHNYQHRLLSQLTRIEQAARDPRKDNYVPPHDHDLADVHAPSVESHDAPTESGPEGSRNRSIYAVTGYAQKKFAAATLERRSGEIPKIAEQPHIRDRWKEYVWLLGDLGNQDAHDILGLMLVNRSETLPQEQRAALTEAYLFAALSGQLDGEKQFKAEKLVELVKACGEIRVAKRCPNRVPNNHGLRQKGRLGCGQRWCPICGTDISGDLRTVFEETPLDDVGSDKDPDGAANRKFTIMIPEDMKLAASLEFEEDRTYALELRLTAALDSLQKRLSGALKWHLKRKEAACLRDRLRLRATSAALDPDLSYLVLDLVCVENHRGELDAVMARLAKALGGEICQVLTNRWYSGIETMAACVSLARSSIMAADPELPVEVFSAWLAASKGRKLVFTFGELRALTDAAHDLRKLQEKQGYKEVCDVPGCFESYRAKLVNNPLLPEERDAVIDPPFFGRRLEIPAKDPERDMWERRATELEGSSRPRAGPT